MKVQDQFNKDGEVRIWDVNTYHFLASLLIA